VSQSQEQLKHIGDVLSVGTVIATLAAWLPPLAALFTIIWTAIRIWETATVQRFLNRFRKEQP
jgi:peptidoglycan biosynthesis protein MviN/MurJ (putative lipid II flippase)